MLPKKAERFMLKHKHNINQVKTSKIEAGWWEEVQR